MSDLKREAAAKVAQRRNELLSQACEDEAVQFGPVFLFVSRVSQNPGFCAETFTLITQQEENNIINEDQAYESLLLMIYDYYKKFQLHEEAKYWEFVKAIQGIMENPTFDRRAAFIIGALHAGAKVAVEGKELGLADLANL